MQKSNNPFSTDPVCAEYYHKFVNKEKYKHKSTFLYPQL